MSYSYALLRYIAQTLRSVALSKIHTQVLKRIHPPPPSLIYPCMLAVFGTYKVNRCNFEKHSTNMIFILSKEIWGSVQAISTNSIFVDQSGVCRPLALV